MSKRKLNLIRLSKRQDRIRVDALAIPRGTMAPGDTEKLLWVSNEYFTAGAVWKRISGVWSCVKSAPIMRWMVGMNSNQAKLELLKKGCHYEWLASCQSITTAEQPNKCLEQGNAQRSALDPHCLAA